MLIDLAITNKIKLSYLFSSRDKDEEKTLFFERADRALKILYQTFPIFFGVVILSILKDVDNSSLALLWLISRTIYIPLYIFGINYLRTGVWAASLVCLILMSIKFI